MIRAAIIGLGRWGRALVTAVQGKSDDIRFVAAEAKLTTAFARRGLVAEYTGRCPPNPVILGSPRRQLASASSRMTFYREQTSNLIVRRELRQRMMGEGTVESVRTDL